LKPGIESAADAGGVVGPDVVAACALSAIPGVGATAMARITQMFGGFSGALEAGPGKIAAAAVQLQLKQEALDYLVRKPDLTELGLWAVAAAKGAGARICVLGDPWYPPQLRGIDNPPPVLYIRGQLEPDALRVAIVGARDSDDYGLELARDISEGLALAGVQVVSGGARGIDAAAHAGALWGSGTTIAVLGCGIDLVYPPENAPLFDRLARGGGAVVSEFPPGTAPDKRNFPRRNRTLSGISAAVVVIRASLGSGSLITANHAAQQGRPIFAVPGSADEPLSAGPNSLLTKDAARAVTSARDVLMGLGWRVPEALNAREPVKRKKARSLAPQPPAQVTNIEDVVLSDEERRLFEALDDRAPQHADELAQKTGIPVAVALSKLSELELKGLATQRPGKYFLRRTA
jgi:DNA processing protein